MGNAAATLVGQNLGAGNPDRAERSVWFTARCNTVFLGTIGVALLAFADPIVGLFTTEPEAADIATACLRTVAYSYVFWAFGLVTVQAFNGSGDTTTPAVINFSSSGWCSSRWPGRCRLRSVLGRAVCSRRSPSRRACSPWSGSRCSEEGGGRHDESE